ncbi:MAG: NAD(P)-dependent oxidoreductase [Ilumatobacteraceae bacterium]
MAFDYPVFLDLSGVAVLVVGGGPVGLRKVTGLVAAGARVTVVSPAFVDGFTALSASLVHRPYESGEAAHYQLVMTATDDPTVNAEVAADAAAAKVWVNSADDPHNCSFILPAVARRGPIAVAVSTGGASPSLAGRIRTEIAATILTDTVEATALDLARQRAAIHSAGGSTEDIDWSEAVEAAFLPTAPPPTSHDV